MYGTRDIPIAVIIVLETRPIIVKSFESVIGTIPAGVTYLDIWERSPGT
jgi:hypothetical protein